MQRIPIALLCTFNDRMAICIRALYLTQCKSFAKSIATVSSSSCCYEKTSRLGGVQLCLGLLSYLLIDR